MTKYDGFEMNGCIIVSNDDGTINYEAVPCPTSKDKIDIWTVYGHIPKAGVEALADCPTKEIAEAIRQALEEKYLKK